MGSGRPWGTTAPSSCTGTATAWTTIASPNPGGLDIALFGVSAVSSTDAWAVGYFQTRGGADRTLVLQWDGVAWSKVPSGDNPGRYTNIMYGVSAASSTDVWAVGSYDRAGERPLVLHWDGRAWSNVQSPGSAGSELLAVDTVSSTEAWAVGYFVAQRGGTRTLTLHWDGRAWSKVASPSPGFDNVASGVSAVSSTDAWTVGSYRGATPSHKLMLHWDGVRGRGSGVPGSRHGHGPNSKALPGRNFDA